MSMNHIASGNTKSFLSNILPKDVQPNAVDLRVGKVLAISSDPMILNEDEKLHRGSFEIEPDVDGDWLLAPGHYEVVMDNEIKVGDNEAGFVITRSTLNRNGIYLTSGLYDTGYVGIMAACLHVNCGLLRLRKGTRIGQYLSFDAEALHHYDGSYGSNKQHDEKYKGK